MVYRHGHPSHFISFDSYKDKNINNSTLAINKSNLISYLGFTFYENAKLGSKS